MEQLIERLSGLTDTRRQWGNLRHKLVDIVFIGLVSVICGGTDFEHMEDTGYGKEEWFRERLELPNGIPDSDTFRRVFERLDPKELAEILQETVDVEGKVLAIDGKTLRGSANDQHRAYHVVSAWVAENQITLGQLAIDQKSNEITAIPELLDMLDISGSTVPRGDAAVLPPSRGGVPSAKAVERQRQALCRLRRVHAGERQGGEHHKKLKRKLSLAGAAMSNIYTVDSAEGGEAFLRSLKFGSEEMEKFVRDSRYKLYVFDPVQGYIPPNLNMGSRNAMRDCLAPLISLGEETGATFLIVAHTNKRKGAFGRDRIADRRNCQTSRPVIYCHRCITGRNIRKETPCV